MMRRTLAGLSCVLALLLTCAGCHRDEHRRKLIVVIVPSQDNPYFKAEADAAAARALELGYRVRVDAHEDDAFRQDNLVDAAIASNAAAIILDNAGADATVSAVRRATIAGIAVFLIDREIDATGIAKAQIISDNDQGARLVAAEFARAMNGSGEYAELLGKESDTNAQIRTQGFHAVLDQYSNLKRVSAQSANWSQAEAFQKTETMLQAHGNIAGIIAGNDTMALGALNAAESLGLDPRVPDVIGIAQYGVVYTGHQSKIAEHGGAAPDDRDVEPHESSRAPSCGAGTFSVLTFLPPA